MDENLYPGTTTIVAKIIDHSGTIEEITILLD
jgi:hypothetical protein